MSKILSIVVPIYNEEKTLQEILNKVINLELPEGFQKELILCNDNSKDSTPEIIQTYKDKYSFVKSIKNQSNLGKSQTVRKGILASTGDYVVIQDADLEYDPADVAFMLDQTLKKNCDVCYGNRFGQYNGVIYWKNFLPSLAFVCTL